MTKRIFILLIIIGVSLLGISYKIALNNERGRLLVAHAYYGDLLSVKEDIEEGAPINFTYYFSDDERDYAAVEFNALHAAASSGNEDIINFLLGKKMNIDSQTPNGWTPLFIAARDGHAEAAKLLLFRKAHPNIQTDLGATALLMAITQPYPSEKERLDLVTYMLKRGTKPNLATYDGLTPLYYAAVTQNLPIVEVLIENGANLSSKEYELVVSYLEKNPRSDNKKILHALKKAISTPSEK